jgi:putative component of membrane protein insertase Oxa1/YidC/SpoIIIJ protein YidD
VWQMSATAMLLSECIFLATLSVKMWLLTHPAFWSASSGSDRRFYRCHRRCRGGAAMVSAHD